MYNDTFLKHTIKTNIRVHFLEQEQANQFSPELFFFFFFIFIYLVKNLKTHPFIYLYVYIGIKVTCNLAHVPFQL